MDHICDCLVLALVLWLGNYVAYLCLNHGLAPNARLQQLLRYLPASIVAVLPLAVTDTDVLQPMVIKLLAIAELWALAYPLTYHLTYRHTSPDYDHRMDPAFAIYLFGIMGGMAVLLPTVVMAVLCVLAVVLPVFILGYYVIYKHVIDMNGMLLILQTNYNEILEFFRTYSLWKTIIGIVAVVVAVAAFAVGGNEFVSGTVEIWMMAVILVMIVAVGYYLFKPRHGVFTRIAIVKLYQEVQEYVHNNSLYSKNQQQRMQTLNANCIHPLSSPHTILLVIGESASRDFMSAFSSMKEDTTPWMRSLATDNSHCVLFPNAYSCDIQTVPTLEKALTAFNQYDGGAFYTSTSIVDIAKKLGYKVHWYSNQGHLGSADTPITLVAETSDVAKWTNQQLGRKYYDEALIDFIPELDATCNNLLVLHLKGSHFNYENRFPETYRQWGERGNHDQITNYKNTIYYTDCIISKAFEVLRSKYNLQAMVYCSDHGDVPDRHRQPNFGGFSDTRIPLMVWMSDEYLEKRPERANALRENAARYWTNDLLYDLLCGVMDVDCPEFREYNSLASAQYKYDRNDLTIMKGSVHISDDEAMEKGGSV